jgi:acyl-CoA synthetase (AMP-forming)/AMP-acid ligase II
VASLEEFEKALTFPIIESYGLTEAGSQVTSDPLPPKPRQAGSVVQPYGLELAVFNEGRLEGPGRIGQVGLKGANVFSGYWQNEETSRAAFDGPLFMTGDLGELDGDGYHFLKGQTMELINRAGEMISPQEIEEVLYRVPGVESAARVGVPHKLYGEEVVAFITPANGQEEKIADLTEICLKYLSQFKIPKRFNFSQNLPKGPSGKIQRLKLIDDYLALAAQGQGLDEE